MTDNQPRPLIAVVDDESHIRRVLALALRDSGYDVTGVTLKLLHADRNLPTLAGKGYVFNGLTHDSYVVEYQEKPDCMSHDIYESIEEMPWSTDKTTLGEILQVIKNDLGENAVLEFDRNIAITAHCSCGGSKTLLCPVHKLRGEMLLCDHCGGTMQFSSAHMLHGDEDFLEKTPAEIGIPPLHIVCGRTGTTMKYYEFTGDQYILK